MINLAMKFVLTFYNHRATTRSSCALSVSIIMPSSRSIIMSEYLFHRSITLFLLRMTIVFRFLHSVGRESILHHVHAGNVYHGGAVQTELRETGQTNDPHSRYVANVHIRSPPLTVEITSSIMRVCGFMSGV